MRALVVYGSERGGTTGLAEMIAAAFRELGWAARTADAADPATTVEDGDDIVIVGGALYANRWHRAARRFVRANERLLSETPVWLFSSGPLDDSARSGGIAPVSQVQELARRIQARGHMTFGGRLQPDARGLFARAMAKKFAGDWRDPSQVEEWVRRIIHDLVPVAASVPPAEALADLPRQRTRRAVLEA